MLKNWSSFDGSTLSQATEVIVLVWFILFFMLSKINKRYKNFIIVWVLMGGLKRIRKCLLSADQHAEIVSNYLLPINFFK